jgi:putative transposase
MFYIRNFKKLSKVLMNNHIHLILQPTTKEGLQKVLKPLHMRYSQYINKQQNITGILWQGRFFSSPLDNNFCHYRKRKHHYDDYLAE